MSIAFLFFEWAAIPSTIFAGYISDKFFKGYRMPPAIIAVSIIFFCIFGYWQSESLLWAVSYTHLDVYKRQAWVVFRTSKQELMNTF